jgi:hypothetical protein
MGEPCILHYKKASILFKEVFNFLRIRFFPLESVSRDYERTKPYRNYRFPELMAKVAMGRVYFCHEFQLRSE